MTSYTIRAVVDRYGHATPVVSAEARQVALAYVESARRSAAEATDHDRQQGHRNP